MFKTYKKAIVFTIIATLIAIFSGAVNWVFQFTCIGLVYFFASLCILRNDKPKNKVISLAILISPFLLIYGFVLIPKLLEFKRLHVLPILIFPVVNAFFGYLFYKVKAKPYSKVIYVGIIIIMGYIGMPNWLNFSFDEENPIDKPFPKLKLNDIYDNTFQFEKDKVIVLDLWSTACGICIKKFPDFEALKLKYKDDKSIEFYALYLPLKRDSIIDVKSYVKDYKFNSLFAIEISSWKTLDNRTVPKLLILNKDQRIVYKGRMNDKWYHFYNNINSLIEKYIND
ncbi:MAG: TlpA family protein disulfide reductase [Flavobacteriaceae bacterium]|nr:TlpA family protein disulfide reductase [Flavobacteriaceae bacterium]